MADMPEEDTHFLDSRPRSLAENAILAQNEHDVQAVYRQVKATSAWFQQASDAVKREVVLQIVLCVQNTSIMRTVRDLLRPLSGKDRAYARARPRSGLDGDNAKADTNHMLLDSDIDNAFGPLYTWFRLADGRSQKLFLVNFLRICEPHILQMVASVACESVHEETDTPQTSSSSFASRRLKSGVSFHESVMNSNSQDVEPQNYGRVQSAGSRRPMSTSVTASRPTQSILSNKLQQSPRQKQRDEPSEWGLGIQDLSGDEDEFPEYTRARLRSTKVSQSRPMSMSAGSSASQRRIGSVGASADAQKHVGKAQYKDFVRLLPIHLSKRILSYLDLKEIHHSRLVCKFWKLVADQVISEFYVQQEITQEVMMIRGTTAEQVNPYYANDMNVPVPIHGSDADAADNREEPPTTSVSDSTSVSSSSKFDSSAKSPSPSKQHGAEPNYTDPSALYQMAYEGVATRSVIMEERNVFCGSFNTIVVSQEEPNPARLTHSTNGKMVAEVFEEMRIRLFDCERSEKVRLGPKMRSYLQGHVGAIHCMLLLEDQNTLISGGFDTTIRKWDLQAAKCVKIFHGHLNTITCVYAHGDMLASTSRDRTCKIWQLNTRVKKPIHSLEHRQPLTAVAFDIKICVTGDDHGLLKVWDMRRRKPVKSMKAHHNSVSVIRLDRWHIVSAGYDGYVKVWSAIGKCKRNLMALRHPKAVRSMQFMYMRVITGCDDGRVRVWNMLTGQCCRVLRGNSRSEPVLGMFATENLDKIVVSTRSNILAYAFRAIDWNYDSQNEHVSSDLASVITSTSSSKPDELGERKAARKMPYSYVRAQRMAITGCSDSRIVQHVLNTVEEVPASDSDLSAVNERANSACSSNVSRLSRSTLSHSAFSLSPVAVGRARRLQRAAIALARATSPDWPPSHRHDLFFTPRARVQSAPPVIRALQDAAASSVASRVQKAAPKQKPNSTLTPQAKAKPKAKTEVRGAEKVASVALVTPADPATASSTKPQRRFSFSFEKPVPTIQELESETQGFLSSNDSVTLQEVKESLRHRIRHPDQYETPEYVDAARSMIQRKQAVRTPNMAELEPGYLARDLRKVMLEDAATAQYFKPPESESDATSLSRPSSSPGWYDVSTRMDADTIKRERKTIMSVPSPVTVQHLTTQQLQLLHPAALVSSAEKQRLTTDRKPTVTVVNTLYAPQHCEVKSASPMFDDCVRSTIPEARQVRPVSASPVYQGTQIRRATLRGAVLSNKGRTQQQQTTVIENQETLYGVAKHAMTPEERRQHLRGLSTRSKSEAMIVPIKMYPPGFLENLKSSLRQKALENRNQRDRIAAISPGLGATMPVSSSPFERVNLQLQTHAEATKKADEVRKIYEKQRVDEEEREARQRKERWLRIATAPPTRPAFVK